MEVELCRLIEDIRRILCTPLFTSFLVHVLISQNKYNLTSDSKKRQIRKLIISVHCYLGILMILGNN